MKTRNFALLAALAAFGWSGAVHAQPGYPPPPPPPDSGYGQPPYDQPGANNPPYDQPGYGNPDDAPYYDDQGPDNSYDDNGPGPGYDSGYGQPGYDQSPQGPVDVSVFYSSLHPYGRWIQRGGYGWVWEPTVVRVGWRPYTVGRWVDTDYGWTWVSDEPWGWATYHYGRWLFDSEYGWLWVPGTEWGPAWCSFQEADGYIGWAPLPPTVGFRAGIGIQIGGLSLSASFTPYAYSFVPTRSFLETRIDRVILPPARNVTFLRRSRNITNITVVNNRIINRSVPEDRVEQWTGHRVQRFRVADVRNPAQAPRRGAEIQGDQVRIFRPAPTLAPARPSETPQAVINRRAYRPAPGQPGQPQPQPVPGQAPEGRWRRQPPQPGQVQPGPGQQPQPVPQSRWQRQPPTPQDLDRKHQAEEQRLQSQQTEERNRLQQLQTQERQSQRDRTRAQQLDAQHQAEMKAMQEQQQREQQVQRAREQREKQAVESRRNQGPPPGQDRRNQGGQGQGQDQGQGKGQGKGQGQGQEKNRERRQQPPPPPPPGR